MENYCLRFDAMSMTTLNCQRKILLEIPYFRGLMTTDMKEQKTGTIDLVDDDCTIVGKYLNIVQVGQLNENFHDLCNLLVLADKWLDEVRFKLFYTSWCQQLNAGTIGIAVEFCVTFKNLFVPGSPMKSLLSPLCQCLNTNFKDLTSTSVSGLEFLLDLTGLDQLQKLYFICTFAEDYPRSPLKSYFRMLDMAAILKNRCNVLLPKLLKRISRSQNVELMGIVLGAFATQYRLAAREYDFERVVEPAEFDLTKFSFGPVETKMVPNASSSYQQIRTMYDGHFEWCLKLSDAELRFSRFGTGAETEAPMSALITLKSTQHSEFITVMDKIYNSTLNEVFRLRTELRMRHINTPTDIELGNRFKNPVRSWLDKHGNDNRPGTKYLACKVKQSSSRGLMTKLVDCHTGVEYSHEEAYKINKFRCTECAISMYVYSGPGGHLYFICNLRKIYLEKLTS